MQRQKQKTPMKVLIAEDDPILRRMLHATISEWGHEVIVVSDGDEAWQALRSPEGPRLAVLDWMMPGMDGIEVCKRVREQPTSEPPYIILLSGRDSTADIVAGLQNGANDYVIKSFNREELYARLQVGCRVVELQHTLVNRVRQLEEAFTQIKELRTLLPICCSCKKIRDDHDDWHQLEDYMLDHSEIRFSHDLCPVCLQHGINALHEDFD
jgi:phosphoserine phosphatase RsbU/P